MLGGGAQARHVAELRRALHQTRLAEGLQFPAFPALEVASHGDVEPVPPESVRRSLHVDGDFLSGRRVRRELAHYLDLGTSEEVAVFGKGIIGAGVAEDSAHDGDVTRGAGMGE